MAVVTGDGKIEAQALGGSTQQELLERVAKLEAENRQFRREEEDLRAQNAELSAELLHAENGTSPAPSSWLCSSWQNRSVSGPSPDMLTIRAKRYNENKHNRGGVNGGECQSYHCIDRSRWECYEYTDQEYPSGDWDEGRNKKFTPTADGFMAFCASWPWNKKTGAFGGFGKCPSNYHVPLPKPDPGGGVYKKSENTQCGSGGTCSTSDSNFTIDGSEELAGISREDVSSCKEKCDGVKACAGFEYDETEGMCNFRGSVLCATNQSANSDCYEKLHILGGKFITNQSEQVVTQVLYQEGDTGSPRGASGEIPVTPGVMYTVKFEILRNNLRSSSSEVQHVLIDGRELGVCKPGYVSSTDNSICKFFTCPYTSQPPLVITAHTDSMNVSFTTSGSNAECACDKEWNCKTDTRETSTHRRRRRIAEGGSYFAENEAIDKEFWHYTRMTAVGRVTLTPSSVEGSAVRRRRSDKDTDGGGYLASCRRRTDGGKLDLPRGLMCPRDDRRRRSTKYQNDDLIRSDEHPGCHDEAYPIQNIRGPQGGEAQWDLAICYEKESQAVDEIKIYSRTYSPSDWENADKYAPMAVRRRITMHTSHFTRRRSHWADVRDLWLMTQKPRKFINGVPYCEGWCCAFPDEECTEDPESCPKCRYGSLRWPSSRPADYRESDTDGDGIADAQNPFFCVPRICGLRKISIAQEKTCCEQFHCNDGVGGDCYEYISTEYPVGSWSDAENGLHGRTAHWIHARNSESFGTWCNSWDGNADFQTVNGSFNGGRGHCPEGGGPRVREASCSAAEGNLTDCECSEGECMCLGAIHGKTSGESFGPTEPDGFLEEQARVEPATTPAPVGVGTSLAEHVDSPGQTTTGAGGTSTAGRTPSLAEHAQPAPVAASNPTTEPGDVCDLKYAFSPAPMSTSIECDCKSCTFRPTDAAETKFKSDCEKCDCVQQASSQCMDSQGTPDDQRVFSSEDRHYLMTWGLAGDFFEGPYCHYAGCHPRTTCKKLRCEAFGSKEDSDCYSLNKDEWALEQMLGNSSADINHPGLQDPNLGEWRDDFSWVNGRKRTDPFDPDQNFCKALKSLMMSHVYFETGFVPFSDKEETAEADVKLESDQDFQKFDSWTKNPQFKHRSHCVNQFWSETYAEGEPEAETGPQPTSLLQNRANVMDTIRGQLDRVQDVAHMMGSKRGRGGRRRRRGGI